MDHARNVVMLFASVILTSCQMGRSCSDFDSLKFKSGLRLCDGKEVSGDGTLIAEIDGDFIIVQRSNQRVLRLKISGSRDVISCFRQNEPTPVTYLGKLAYDAEEPTISLLTIFTRDEEGKMQTCE